MREGGETERGEMGIKRGYTSLVATNSGNSYKVAFSGIGNLKQTAAGKHELQNILDVYLIQNTPQHQLA